MIYSSVDLPSRAVLSLSLLFLVSLGFLRASAPGERFFVNDQDVTGPRVVLPAPTGPHSVGTVTYHWIDRTRDEAATQEPNDLRQVIAQIWYPADLVPGAVSARYVPQLESMRRGIPVRAGEMPRKIAQNLARYALVRTHSLREAPFEKAMKDKLYPVLIFSPGGNMSRHWHTALLQEIASQGYIGVAISHAYSGWDVFPAGGFLKSVSWRMDSEDPEVARQGEEALSDTLAGDASFVLDRLVELHQDDPQGRFTGRLDLGSIALVGHSRGGKTVARGASRDSRFRACVVLDNIGPDRERKTGLSCPQLTLRAPWPEGRVVRLHDYLRKNRSQIGAFDLSVRGAGHFSFSDLPMVDPDNYPSEGDPRRLHQVISRTVLYFLDQVLVERERVSFQEISEQFPELEVHQVAW